MGSVVAHFVHEFIEHGNESLIPGFAVRDEDGVGTQRSVCLQNRAVLENYATIATPLRSAAALQKALLRERRLQVAAVAQLGVFSFLGGVEENRGEDSSGAEFVDA